MQLLRELGRPATLLSEPTTAGTRFQLFDDVVAVLRDAACPPPAPDRPDRRRGRGGMGHPRSGDPRQLAARVRARRGAAGRQAQTGGQPHGGAAGQRQPDRLQRGAQPAAATGTRGGQAGDLFGEPAHRAAAILTDKQAYPQHDHHPSTAHRRIGKSTPVAAVHPRTRATTPRAGHLVGLRARPDPHLDRAELDSFDPHLGQVRKQDLKTVIIAPAAPYTVDDRSRRRDQPRSTKVGPELDLSGPRVHDRPSSQHSRSSREGVAMGEAAPATASTLPRSPAPLTRHLRGCQPGDLGIARQVLHVLVTRRGNVPAAQATRSLARCLSVPG